MTDPVTSQAPSAALTLGEALGLLYAQGTPPPCHGSDLWNSEDPEHRAVAAEHCPACPITDKCTAAAVEGRTTFGVWGGHDVGTAAGRQELTTMTTDLAAPCPSTPPGDGAAGLPVTEGS